MTEIGPGHVFLAALLTALATGLGALPFLFVPHMRRRWLGVSNCLAAGLMLGASFYLLLEGFAFSPGRTLVGVLLGLALVDIGHRVLNHHPDLSIADIHGANAAKALMIVGVMTVHSMAEGIGVGVAYGDGATLGNFITAAIAVHNIPEGLAISLVLIPRGASVLQAAGWSVFSSLPQPLLAVPAFLFVLAFQPWLPLGLGLAAGAMIWMTLADLVPDALEDVSNHTVAIVVTLSLTAMLAFQEFVLQ